jgi:hypothetical protein
MLDEQRALEICQRTAHRAVQDPRSWATMMGVELNPDALLCLRYERIVLYSVASAVYPGKAIRVSPFSGLSLT